MKSQSRSSVHISSRIVDVDEPVTISYGEPVEIAILSWTVDVDEPVTIPYGSR